MARRRAAKPGPYLLELKCLRERIPDASVFPYTIPVVRHLTTLAFHPKVTFFVGENGSGKSTILEAIAVAMGLNAEGGSASFRFATRESHSTLDECLRLSRTLVSPADSYFLRAESFFNVATEIENLDKEPFGPKLIGAYGGESLHEQSHGESFFALFKNRFRDNGLYFMDEPEAALSPQRQLAFLSILHDYIRRGCQFVIATHSPIILAYPEATIHHFSHKGIRTVPYTETEHYLITRDFLVQPQRYLKTLLDLPPIKDD